jgi:hypothetical protein
MSRQNLEVWEAPENSEGAKLVALAKTKTKDVSFY